MHRDHELSWRGRSAFTSLLEAEIRVSRLTAEADTNEAMFDKLLRYCVHLRRMKPGGVHCPMHCLFLCFRLSAYEMQIVPVQERMDRRRLKRRKKESRSCC